MYEHYVLNSVGMLLVLLMHVAIQHAYGHYMLTPYVEYLLYVTF